MLDARHVEFDAEFADFVRERQARLYAFALLVCGHREDSLDLVQSVLVKAYQNWAKLRELQDVDAYIRRMIINAHVSRWRLTWRRRERSSADMPDTPSFDTYVDQAWALVMALPTRQRAVIALRYYDDRSIAETAEILGCAEGTVKSQASRALATLRKLIDLDATEGADRE